MGSSNNSPGQDDGDNFDEFGNKLDDELNALISDSELADELGLITPDMVEDLARYMADQWREREESKPIKPDLSLATALKATPVQWLNAACGFHRISSKGLKKNKTATLTTRLLDPELFKDFLQRTPPHARAALRKVMSNGGWIKLSALIKDFGDMDGDGWFWDEVPPESSLGELRQRALLFVGKAIVGKGGKAFKIAVVPKELRDPINKILADPNVKAEEEEAILAHFAPPEELLREAMDAVRVHFAEIEWDTIAKQNDIEGFLLDANEQNYDPLAVWHSLEVALDFLDHQAHEIQTLDDIASYHLSELVHEFVDIHFAPRWNLNMRRDLLETVQRFYEHLHKTGRVADDALEEVTLAAKQMNAGKRKLDVIKRPPPLGGELVMARINPNTNQEEQYTINHQRVLMCWASEFHQDWRHMLQVCQTVYAGERKAELVQEVISLEPSTQELLVSQADEDDFAVAVNWFYKEAVLDLSAW